MCLSSCGKHVFAFFFEQFVHVKGFHIFLRDCDGICFAVRVWCVCVCVGGEDLVPSCVLEEFTHKILREM